MANDAATEPPATTERRGQWEANKNHPLRSSHNRWLVLSSLGVVACAMALPFTPLAPYLGFVPLPPAYFALLAVLLGTYLVMVEGAKQWFYRWLLPRTV